MKKLILIFGIFLSILSSAQVQDTLTSKKLYVKANALFVPIGVLNAGIEYQLTKKITLQGEVFISPWKSFAGKYAQVYLLGLDGRYYFDEAFRHFYVGANISTTYYIIQKYNYWSDDPYQYTPASPIYVTSDLYQKGFSVIFGAVVGYQFELGPKWNMDLYLGAGSIQSYYQGFHKTLGIRYDTNGKKWDRSGEFLPYRGGIMISYKLR